MYINTAGISRRAIGFMPHAPNRVNTWALWPFNSLVNCLVIALNTSKESIDAKVAFYSATFPHQANIRRSCLQSSFRGIVTIAKAWPSTERLN